MDIYVAENAGFCFGVKRAVELLYRAIKENDPPIYTLGPIIHNPQIIRETAQKGVRVIDRVEDLPENAVCVVRAHGLPEKDYERLARITGRVIDTTCPFVAKIHKIVKESCEKGHAVLIAGDENHPEVIGIRGFADPDRCFVFKSEKQLDEIAKKISEKGIEFVDIVAQTTFSIKEFKKYEKIIKKYFKNPRIYDTICSATELRQKETLDLAARCDAFLVIGGKTSSNTNKLFDIASSVCENSFLIESGSDIPIATIKKFKTVGITAGASTPTRVIEEVKDIMSEETKNVAEVGEMTFAQMLEDSFRTITTGERVKVVVVGVTPTEIKVELGTKQSGFITKDNYSGDPSIDLEQEVHIGDEFDAIVLRVSDVEGTISLSKKKVDALAGFEKIEKAFEKKETVEGTVTGVNNGGLTVQVHGVRVFVPMSLTGKPRDFDFSELVKQDVKLNIIEYSINRGRKKIIGSMKAIASAERKQAQEEFWANAAIGQKYTGIVRSENSIKSFGVFVDIGGVDGLVHITELSWKKLKNPSEVVKAGDTLEVYIKDLDRENRKVSLGYKKPEDNPFKLFTEQYGEGDVVKVKIVNLMPFGAFANIVDGVDGLIHISQLSDKRVGKPSDVVSVGQEVEVKIVDINYTTEKIGLSIRALLEEQEVKIPDEVKDIVTPAEEETPAVAEEAPAEEVPAAEPVEETPAPEAVEETPVSESAEEAPAAEAAEAETPAEETPAE